ncbi:MAG: hypothetical protein ACE37F_31195 [Nannocystaceae bacterium]|nr:hypothetical protein [bacterium]
MNAPTDPLDWSSLGDAPLEGEMDDAALLEAVLDQAGVAPPANDATPSTSPRWARPVLGAVVLFAAAVLLLLLAPRWKQALRGEADDAALVPHVETPEARDAAERKHASTPRPPARPAPEQPAAVVPSPPTPAAVPAQDLAPPDDAPRRPRSKPPAPPADTLLRKAQDALAAKDASGARRAYERLLVAHPRSAQARAARMSLGRLELAAGRPKKALSHYDAYLRGQGGAMRREAELGRIDALRALGRTSAEQTAIEAFLHAHPKTVHATRLQARLDALR